MKRILIAAAACVWLLCSCNSQNAGTSETKDTSASVTSTSKTDMLEKNKQTALAAQQAFNDHNADGVFKDASPDIVDYGDGSGPPVKGIDSCKAFLKMLMTAFPDMKGENLMPIAEGNEVIVIGDWSGTFKGEFMGMKPTNKPFKFKDADIFTFDDQGKMVEHRSIQSMETVMTQVGATMKR